MKILTRIYDGWKPRKKATAMAIYEPADASALIALQRGDASPEQQQRALGWIITQASGMYEFNYFGDERDTSFALGRAFVGQQIIGIINGTVTKEK